MIGAKLFFFFFECYNVQKEAQSLASSCATVQLSR